MLVTPNLEQLFINVLWEYLEAEKVGHDPLDHKENLEHAKFELLSSGYSEKQVAKIVAKVNAGMDKELFYAAR